jgi:hypothetical protein
VCHFLLVCEHVLREEALPMIPTLILIHSYDDGIKIRSYHSTSKSSQIVSFDHLLYGSS